MRTFVFILAVLLSSSPAFSFKETRSGSIQGSQIFQGASLSEVGNRYVNPLPAIKTFWVEDSYAMIKFYYPLTSASRPSSQTASVTLNVTFEIEENGIFITKQKETTLAINFSSATGSDLSYFKVEKAQKISFTVISTSIPSGWTNVKLEASVTTESFDFLKSEDISSVQFNSPSALNNHLTISWTPAVSAQHYELEWTYVSDQSNVINQRLLPNSVPVDRFLFRNNSSRVEVKGVSYNIPLVYEPGIILYRIRGVGKTISGNVPVIAKTEWTAPDGKFSVASDYTASGGIYVFNGLEQDINWQASVSFAEEGKNKVVIGYHDGTNRNRQTITRINSDLRAVVGETLYDYNGRPVIQLLPVPVTEDKFSFQPFFNRFLNKASIGKSDYDYVQEGLGCSPFAPSFDPGKGASRYFSPANDFNSDSNTINSQLNRNLIPDAKNYPYSQIIYSPDNTGRITAESGVGIYHRVGSGRETKYMYGSPLQPELSRLFGSQAGYAQHYKKNVIKDANGQTSVSYLNLEGKVVATALAGDSPDSLTTLPGERSRTIASGNVIKEGISNFTSLDSLGKVYSSKFTVTGNNINYNFNYSASAPAFNLTCDKNPVQNLNYNFNGTVDVELLLEDKCGSVFFNKIDSTKFGYSGAVQNIEIPQSLSLSQGEYSITKTLKINEEKLESYWQKYLSDTGNCVLTRDNYVNEELAKIDTAGCRLTCESCQEMINNVIASSSTFTSEQIAVLYSTCDEICNDKDISCLSSLQAMLGDLSPGGQYGELRKNKVIQPASPSVDFDSQNNPVHTATNISLEKSDDGFDPGDNSDNIVDSRPFSLSVFNEENRLMLPDFLEGIVTKANWRFPVKITSSDYHGVNVKNEVLFQTSKNLLSPSLQYSLDEYRGKNGEVVFIDVYKINKADGSGYYYSPEILPEYESVLEVKEPLIGLYKIPVRYLKNLSDFEKYWQSHWANYLIVYHPEFKYFLECTSYNISNSFDYALIQTEDVSSATSEGYLINGVPVLINATPSSSADPLALSDDLFYNFIKKKNDNYKSSNNVQFSMAQMSTITAGCPRENGCSNNDCQNGVIDTDLEWNTYKAFYISEKYAYKRAISQQTAAQGKYYNGCIGNADYLINSSDGQYMKENVTVSSPVTYKSCHKKWYNIFNWFEECYNVSYNNVVTFPRHLDPTQLCFDGNGKDYENKTKRFFPSGPAGLGGGVPAERCSTIAFNGVGDTIIVSTPCNADIQNEMEAAVVEGQRFKYTSCGLCPVAADLELFVIDLLAADSLVRNENMVITCDLNHYKVHLGEALRGLIFNNISSPSGTWSSQISGAGDKVLTGYIKENGTTYLTMKLKIPDTVNTSFLTIEKLCCLTIVPAGNYFPTVTGKNFTMIGIYDEGKEFLMEGTIDEFPLSPCTFAPKCMVTSDAYNVTLLLNSLLQTSGNEKGSHIVAPSFVSLSSSTNSIFYNNSIRSIAGKNDRDSYNGFIEDISILNPQWSSTILTNGTLEGELNYTLNGNNKQILIEVVGLNSTQYSSVKEFLHVRIPDTPFPSNDPCMLEQCVRQAFKADAVLISGNQKVFVPVDILVPALRPVSCKPALPPVIEN